MVNNFLFTHHFTGSDGEIAESSSENDEARLNQINTKHQASSPFGRRHFPRDSGCYEGSPIPAGASLMLGGNINGGTVSASSTLSGNGLGVGASQQAVVGNHHLNALNNHHPYHHAHSNNHLGQQNNHSSSHQVLMHADETNSLDDVVAQCSSEILKRVESARRNKDEKCPLRGVQQRIAKKGLLGGGSGGGGGGMISSGEDTLSRGGGALSEKSSDSGVSSSSLSSGPIKNNS